MRTFLCDNCGALLTDGVSRTAALYADPCPDRLGRGEDTILVSRTGAREQKVDGLVGCQDLKEVLEVLQMIVKVARSVAGQ
jgi:hypothetical protein